MWWQLQPLLEAAIGHELPHPTFGPWRLGDQRIFYADTSKAARDFGWTPTTTPEVGLRRMVEWFNDRDADCVVGMKARPAGEPTRVLIVLTYYRPHVSGLTIYADRLARELAPPRPPGFGAHVSLRPFAAEARSSSTGSASFACPSLLGSARAC